MADDPDPTDLARRYLDLWQQQIAALAADPDTADTVQRMMTLWTQNMAAMPAAMAGMTAPTDRMGDEQPAKTGTGDAAGAAAVDAASRDRAMDLDDLAGRVARLEERLAELEAGATRSRRKPARKSKPRSG